MNMSVIKNDIFHLEENYFTAFYDLINKSSIVDIDVDCYSHKIFENFSRARLELMIRRINNYITLAASDDILHDVELIKFTKIHIKYIDFRTGFHLSIDVDAQHGDYLEHKFFSLYPEDFKDETAVTEYDILFYILKNAIHYTDRVLFNAIINIIANDFSFTSLEKYVNDDKIRIIVDKINNDFKPIINPDEYDFKYLVWNDRYKFNLILQDALKVFLTILKFIEWEDKGDNRIERYNVDYQLPELNLYYLSYSNIYKIDIQNSYEYSFDIDAMLKYGDINNLFTYMILTVAYKPILHDALSESMALMDYIGHHISMYSVCAILEVMFGNCTGKPVEEEEEKTYMPVK